MNRILTLTEQQRDALGIALDEHYDERKNYLDTGNLASDYGPEWPEVAATKADICERLGEVEEQLFGNADGAGRWNTLAKAYRESAEEEEEEGYCAEMLCCQQPEPGSDYCVSHAHLEEDEEETAVPQKYELDECDRCHKPGIVLHLVQRNGYDFLCPSCNLAEA